MPKKNDRAGNSDRVPSWVRDLYREDIERVARGDRPRYFGAMGDAPLENVHPEYDLINPRSLLLLGRGPAMGRSLGLVDNELDLYDRARRASGSGITLPEINARIDRGIRGIGDRLPGPLGALWRDGYDFIRMSPDGGVSTGAFPFMRMVQWRANREREANGEYPLGYVDAVDLVWPEEKYGTMSDPRTREEVEQWERWHGTRNAADETLPEVVVTPPPDAVSGADRRMPDGGPYNGSPDFTWIDREGVIGDRGKSYFVNGRAVIDGMRNSGANFVRRLMDPDRATIPDWNIEGNVATHKMAWGMDDDGAYVFPLVQEIDGELVDFTDPKNDRSDADADARAHEVGDMYRVSSPAEAAWITENYKRFFPSGLSRWEDGGRVRMPDGGTYTVKSGDNLSSIAQSVGISVDDLMSMNPDITDPSKIRVGQRINLSAPSSGSSGRLMIKDKYGKEYDPERWYYAINPGLDTDLWTAAVTGLGILGRLRTGERRKDFAPPYEEALWKAYLYNNTEGLPKSSVRFEDDDEDADYVGLPQEQARLVQAVVDPEYAKQRKRELDDAYLYDLYDALVFPSRAKDDIRVAQVVMDNPNEWILINEKHSPARMRSSTEDESGETAYTGLGGLKTFSVRWHPETRMLDVKDDYNFDEDDFVEGRIPQRARPLRIRDRIYIPEEGSYMRRNPEYFRDMGYQPRFETSDYPTRWDTGGQFMVDPWGSVIPDVDTPASTGRAYGKGKGVVDPERANERKRQDVYDDVWVYLTEEAGFNAPQAIGILANIAAESGGDTTALGPAGDFGIQQWLGPRKDALRRMYGERPTLEQQLQYLVDEHSGNIPGLGWNYQSMGRFFDKDAQGNEYGYYMYSKEDFMNARNYKDATVMWNQGFGRPLGSTLRNDVRVRFAERFAERYGVAEDEPATIKLGDDSEAPTDGGIETAASATTPPVSPAEAPRVSAAANEWWDSEGRNLVYGIMSGVGANAKEIERLSAQLRSDELSAEQAAERRRQEEREAAKRQVAMNIISGIRLNIPGMSRNG